MEQRTFLIVPINKISKYKERDASKTRVPSKQSKINEEAVKPLVAVG